jgi:hypothetical protein
MMASSINAVPEIWTIPLCAISPTFGKKVLVFFIVQSVVYSNILLHIARGDKLFCAHASKGPLDITANCRICFKLF